MDTPQVTMLGSSPATFQLCLDHSCVLPNYLLLNQMNPEEKLDLISERSSNLHSYL